MWWLVNEWLERNGQLSFWLEGGTSEIGKKMIRTTSTAQITERAADTVTPTRFSLSHCHRSLDSEDDRTKKKDMSRSRFVVMQRFSSLSNWVFTRRMLSYFWRLSSWIRAIMRHAKKRLKLLAMFVLSPVISIAYSRTRRVVHRCFHDGWLSGWDWIACVHRRKEERGISRQCMYLTGDRADNQRKTLIIFFASLHQRDVVTST